jgi:2-polyprenyl-3-methyl-5-hydroxy-6-metoxy-1,4-benzoquinol methylase
LVGFRNGIGKIGIGTKRKALKLNPQNNLGGKPKATLRCVCDGRFCLSRFEYHEPPVGEVRFNIGTSDAYHRKLMECRLCKHIFSEHELPMEQLYAGQYVDATYGSKGIGAQFDRINGLDPIRSDNSARVKRVHEFASGFLDQRGFPKSPRKVLDVGSGLCVFLNQMKKLDWDCTALDPDERSAEHARSRVGIAAHCGDFFGSNNLGHFHLITFNKVLEHVLDPVGMLLKSRDYLDSRGLVYIELPDGEEAAKIGKNREEFFIDHWHIFSMASLSMLAERASFKLLSSERLLEPSGKFTLRGFLSLE